MATFISALATLAAAFGGAFFAFILNDRKARQKQTEANIEAANQVLFSLFQQVNTLLIYKRDFLDPVRNEAGRHIALRPSMPGQFRRVRMPLEQISFLATPRDAQILFDLAIEQERYETAITTIEVRSSLQLDEVQPRLANIGVKHGEQVTDKDVEVAIGNMLHQYIRDTTDQVYYHVDRTISSIETVKNNLRRVLKSMYPNADIIDFVKQEDTQQDTPADR